MTLLGVLLFVVVMFVMMYLCIDQCAKGNFLFTYNIEGTAKAIMSSGAFERIIFAYKGDKQMYMDNEWNIWSEDELKTNFKQFKDYPGMENDSTVEDLKSILIKRKHWLDEVLRTNWLAKKVFGPNHGLRWVGLPPYHEVYTYKFKWPSKLVDGAEISREEIIDYILIQEDIYLMKIEKVEDKNLLPLNTSILVTLRNVNPYKALFRSQSWFEMITDSLRGICVPYIGSQSFAEMVSGEDDTEQQKPDGPAGKQALADYIWEQLEKDRYGDNMSERQKFIDDYGIRIKNRGVKIDSIDPTSPESAVKITEGAMKKWLGEKEALSIKARYEPFVGNIDKLNPVDKKEAQERMMKIRELEALEKISEGGNLMIDVKEISKGDTALLADHASKKKQR
ncbi:MAG: hypothetical protein COU81_03125 [Candidatus Portnoybacteria bacterium CG10_big_fil_rev_8_21_14_0_10_36_7]|uniref:Band 7 domain-containing protein n=1 Tax=Candidatus Portnoybacteria bacterium CG10_big_fil_rev_8_21_14_0_10_36_7 TaxID=1974812 RepID=A0A2M8KDJ7_9BACT|nr:MAG: hypothetical protein COU81_03125 [Candidatus Portnoybacteria bacterium CG10_big_fil_rev_8_21_14_0_10_36_7]